VQEELLIDVLALAVALVDPSLQRNTRESCHSSLAAVDGVVYRGNDQATQHVDVLELATKVSGSAHKVRSLVGTVSRPARLDTVAPPNRKRSSRERSQTASRARAIPSSELLDLLGERCNSVGGHSVEYDGHALQWRPTGRFAVTIDAGRRRLRLCVGLLHFHAVISLKVEIELGLLVDVCAVAGRLRWRRHLCLHGWSFCWWPCFGIVAVTGALLMLVSCGARGTEGVHKDWNLASCKMLAEDL